MKKKMTAALAMTMAFSIMMTACGGTGNSETTATTVAADNAAAVTTVSAESTEALDDMKDDSQTATGELTITSQSAGANVTSDGQVYTITSAGEYTVTGALEDGQIVVNAGEDDEVKLVLSGVSIKCSTNAPILALSADKVDVEAAKGTYNEVTDLRDTDPAAVSDDSDEASDSAANYDAAIYALCDLKVSGSGTLVVTTDYDNGIKSKDDLTVKNVNLQVEAVGNALKGSDSVTIESGEMILVSSASDGVKTSNSNVSSKGNQKGTVSIQGGHVDIYAACDGISAAYNVEIAETEACTVNIYTASYSEQSEAAATESGDLYLIVPESMYTEAVDYYAYFYNDDETAGTWVKAVYESMVYSGRASFYGLQVKAPSGYANILFVTVVSGATPDGSNQSASTGGETVNSSLNGYLISTIDSGSIEGDWVQLSSGTGSGSNSSKTTFSSKGIKAENQIVQSGGAVTIYSMDDALHANNDNELDNGSTGTGDILITGGTLTITSADDAIHADNTLTISGGNVNIVKSHEGLEANVVTVAGGNVYVNGEDDGINACKGNQTALVNVTGGYLEVTTPSGDTDAIDSNGDFTMSGGFVLVKAGSAMGNMSGSVDVDGSITVTGGSIVALGGICAIPSGDSVNTYVSNGTSFAAGEYTVADGSGNTVLSFTLDGSYTSCWIASEKLELNASYSLAKDGTEVVSWTQSSATEGATGMMNGGMGGMGGFGGRGGMNGGMGGNGNANGGMGGFGGRR